MNTYRANTDLRGHTVVEAEMPCINGLCAWVMVADLGKPMPEDEMFGGIDREALAQRMASALNAGAFLRRIGDALEQAGRAAGPYSVARQFIGMAQQELRVLADASGVQASPTHHSPSQTDPDRAEGKTNG